MLSLCFKYYVKLDSLKWTTTVFHTLKVKLSGSCVRMDENNGDKQSVSSPIFDVMDMETNPLNLFKEWFEKASNTPGISQANAMTLSTVRNDSTPSARMVLLRGFDEKGFRFYTNYSSNKAQEMEANPNVALTLFWGPIFQSVRIEGVVEKLPSSESDDYFNKMPHSYRVGLCVGKDQSSVIANRKVMEERIAKLSDEFAGKSFPRPQFWGGYIVKPTCYEFWKGHGAWIADRILFTKQNENHGWLVQRLEP